MSALALLLHVVVAEVTDEDVESGTLRTSVIDGSSGAKIFRCTKPSISPRSGTLGRLRCPPRAPRFGMSRATCLSGCHHMDAEVQRREEDEEWCNWRIECFNRCSCAD